MTIRGANGIVVGIEGTAAGQGALEWAIREAAVRSCTVTVVHAWDYVSARDAGRMTEHAERTASGCMLDAAVTTAVRSVGVSPNVVVRSVKGPAAKVLLAAAESAQLLVLGRGHRSGAIDVLRHSVSAECVRKSVCPVVVIPTSADIHVHAVGVGSS
jgi:nucleotide-binding universal stress UspA family protein